MQSPSQPLRRRFRALAAGSILLGFLPAIVVAQNEDPAAPETATCLLPDFVGAMAAAEATEAPTPGRSTSIYITMSVGRVDQPPIPGDMMNRGFVIEVSLVSVITSVAELPPATPPTAWPYELTDTVKADVFPVTRTFNRNFPDECPQVTAGEPHLDNIWHSTFIHYQSDQDLYLPASVTLPPSLSGAEEEGRDDEVEVGSGERLVGGGDADDDSSAEVPNCSPDLEMPEELMDPECEAAGWTDTACLGQCPEVDGEMVCVKQWIDASSRAERMRDDNDQVWAVGAYGRACWSFGEPGYKLLNKPCLKGDHWIGCAPGKGYDPSWSATRHDNSDLEF